MPTQKRREESLNCAWAREAQVHLATSFEARHFIKQMQQPSATSKHYRTMATVEFSTSMQVPTRTLRAGSFEPDVCTQALDPCAKTTSFDLHQVMISLR
jgi:hypothetical protein